MDIAIVCLIGAFVHVQAGRIICAEPSIAEAGVRSNMIYAGGGVAAYFVPGAFIDIRAVGTSSRKSGVAGA